MPRPASITPEALARYEANARDAVREDRARPDAIPWPAAFLPVVMEMAIAGGWLFEELRGVGASEDEAAEVTVAHGQMCFPNRDPWAVAERVLADFKHGKIAKPGPELAERLLTGDVSDLPRGGLRIRSVRGGS